MIKSNRIGFGPDNQELPPAIKRYQMRLKRGDELKTLLDSMVWSIMRFLFVYPYPGWRGSTQGEAQHFKLALKRVLDHYVFSYANCGHKDVCFEKMSPIPWNLEANFPFDRPSRGNPRILQLEVKENLDEFCSALELAAFKTILRNWSGSETAKEDIRIGIRGVIKETFGPRLFKRLDEHCDLCLPGDRMSPWGDSESIRKTPDISTIRKPAVELKNKTSKENK